MAQKRAYLEAVAYNLRLLRLLFATHLVFQPCTRLLQIVICKTSPKKALTCLNRVGRPESGRFAVAGTLEIASAPLQAKLVRAELGQNVRRTHFAFTTAQHNLGKARCNKQSCNCYA